MRITIGNNTRRFMSILQLDSYPFTDKDLKQNFRTLIKTHHEDKNKSPNAKEMSQKIIEAYNALKNLAVSELTESDKEDAYRKFEESLEDMFKGKLWETCKECNGARKIKRPKSKWISCPLCHGSRVVYPRCPDCHGSGKFTTARTKRVVECRRCKGFGFDFNRRPSLCPKCGGMGMIIKQVGEDWVSCMHCAGLGRKEIRPFNPAIKTGAVLI